MTEHPKDLASFRMALLEGDRRLARRRRRTRATAATAALAAIAVIVAFPFRGGALDAPALAAQAQRALQHPGLVLHSETEVVGPDGRIDQRISRWSLGARSRTVSVARNRRVEQMSDGRTIRVRLEPGGPIDTLTAGGGVPDPLFEYRRALDRSAQAEEVEVDGVPAYRLTVSGVVPQVAYFRRSDRLPIRVELEGGTVLRYRTVEWVPANEALLRLR